MPYLVNMTFEARDDLKFDIVNSGRIVQKLFYDLVRLSDPQLAWVIHNVNTLKPFTVSRITTRKDLVKTTVVEVPKDERLKMTIKLLDDDLLNHVLDGLAELNTYTIGKSKIELIDIFVRGETYGEMLDAKPAKKIKAIFITPTFFAKEYPYPFPPQAIMKSWLMTWNNYAPKQNRIKNNIEEILQCPKTTSPTHGKSHAPKLYLGGKQVIIKAYTGTQTLTIKHCKKTTRKTIHILAKYANYSGTGRMTRMGLGTTKTLTET